MVKKNLHQILIELTFVRKMIDRQMNNLYPLYQRTGFEILFKRQNQRQTTKKVYLDLLRIKQDFVDLIDKIYDTLGISNEDKSNTSDAILLANFQPDSFTLQRALGYVYPHLKLTTMIQQKQDLAITTRQKGDIQKAVTIEDEIYGSQDAIQQELNRLENLITGIKKTL